VRNGLAVDASVGARNSGRQTAYIIGPQLDFLSCSTTTQAYSLQTRREDAIAWFTLLYSCFAIRCHWVLGLATLVVESRFFETRKAVVDRDQRCLYDAHDLRMRRDLLVVICKNLVGHQLEIRISLCNN